MAFLTRTSAAPSPRVHTIVRVDYVVRVTTLPLYLLLYGTHLWPRHPGPQVWAILVAYFLVWPHVAKAVATRSADSKKAELRNLLVDSFFTGMGVPLARFSLFPNAAAFLGIHSGNVLNGGLPQAIKGLVWYAVGVAFMSLIVGVDVDILGASLVTQVLSMVVVAAFTTVFSYFTFSQSRDVISRGRQIRQQAAQIAEKSALLEQRSVELEHALVLANAANAAKGNFLANMSHELRTPLNSIIGFANILRRNVAGMLAPRELTYLERIVSNGSHLLLLINGVLDLSKIEAQQVQLELSDVDVSAMLRDTLSELEPQAEARHVELVGEIPDSKLLHTDRARLKQITLNLVGNAIKFTHEGRVTLCMQVDTESGTPSRIDVIDTGIGIAADRVDAIFDAFQQEDTTTTRQYGGTGLGLTITRSLAHLMGWEIEVESEVGKGSTFSVVMKRPPSDPPNISGEYPRVIPGDSGRAA